MDEGRDGGCGRELTEVEEVDRYTVSIGPSLQMLGVGVGVGVPSAPPCDLRGRESAKRICCFCPSHPCCCYSSCCGQRSRWLAARSCVVLDLEHCQARFKGEVLNGMVALHTCLDDLVEADCRLASRHIEDCRQ